MGRLDAVVYKRNTRSFSLSVCTKIAGLLDEEMLKSRGTGVPYSSSTPDHALPQRTGFEVAEELGGRFLLRYLRFADVRKHRLTGMVWSGFPDRAWATPTPYTPREAVTALFLPSSTEPRTHALLLRPEKIPVLRGPRFVAAGKGIEYLLPVGYPQEALVYPWELVVE